MRRISILLFTFVTFLVAAAWPQSDAPKKQQIITLDPPGSAFTLSFSINPAGAIAGAFLDANGVIHGFLRGPDGTITTFDAPGAGTGPGQGTDTGNACGLNPAGAIAGEFLDDNNVYHGYVRSPDSTITEFDVSGAGTGPGQGTDAGHINPAGTISAPYIDSSGVSHSYLRTADGAVTKYDIPGAGTGSGQGTMGSCINPGGAITGYYIDSSNGFHGFLQE